MDTLLTYAHKTSLTTHKTEESDIPLTYIQTRQPHTPLTYTRLSTHKSNHVPLSHRYTRLSSHIPLSHTPLTYVHKTEHPSHKSNHIAVSRTCTTLSTRLTSIHKTGYSHLYTQDWAATCPSHLHTQDWATTYPSHIDPHTTLIYIYTYTRLGTSHMCRSSHMPLTHAPKCATVGILVLSSVIHDSAACIVLLTTSAINLTP